MAAVNTYALNMNDFRIYRKSSLIIFEMLWMLLAVNAQQPLSVLQLTNKIIKNNSGFVFSINLYVWVILFAMQLKKKNPCIPKCYREVSSLLEINLDNHREF